VAEAEVALASRDLGWPARALDAAAATLEAHGDQVNAAHARLLGLRRLVLIGRLDEAEHKLDAVDGVPVRPALRAAHELVVAGIALRRLHARVARGALARAGQAARESGIPALDAEVERARSILNAPAARLLTNGTERLLVLEDVESLLASPLLVVDACRHAVRARGRQVLLARRPVLFALVRALADAWPGDATREALVARAFRGKRADESYRARLRVEIGRLRKALHGLAGIHATPAGFALKVSGSREVVVLAPPVDGEFAAVLAFLADGEAWSSSALALALGASQRTAQRALDELAAAGKVQWLGRGRSRRWLTAPLPGFTPSLLLPAPFPGS
jgi:hypothetical protein